MKFLVDKVKGVDLNLKADWGETAFDHVNGRKGLEEVQACLQDEDPRMHLHMCILMCMTCVWHVCMACTQVQAFLKMRVAAHAVQAAIRFKSMAKFKKGGGAKEGEAAAPAAEVAA